MNDYKVPRRLTALLVHLVCSAALYLVILITLRTTWYPGPLFELSRGPDLMRLIVLTNLVAGPVLTLVIADPNKARKELRRDIFSVVSIQLLALSYGIYSLEVNRPKYLVYNAGQFNVVSTRTLDDGPIPNNLGSSSWHPIAIGARQPDSLEDQQRILFDALDGGHDIHSIPELLVPYADVKNEVRERALTAEEYVKTHGGELAALETLVGTPAARHGALPLIINNSHATVVVNKDTGKIISLGLPYN